MGLVTRRQESSGWFSVIVLAATCCAVTVFAASSAPPVKQILGEWRGTSLCADKQKFPGCHDEVVIYTVIPSSTHTGAVTVTAEKIVNGVRDTMGVSDFTYDAAHRTWNSELQTERYHLLWSFSIRDTVLSGTLLDLPSKAISRKVRAIRR